MTDVGTQILDQHLADARCGTFTTLILKKKGVTRGRGNHRKVYADDRVMMLILTGFRYGTMVRKSLDLLPTITDAQVAARAVELGYTEENGYLMTPGLITSARDEYRDSLEASLDGTNTSTTDHVFNPLVVGNQEVRGTRVYECVAGDPDHICHCRACENGDPRAPLSGTRYLQGRKIYEVVLEKAANGPPPLPNSAPKTVAKKALRSHLPINYYVSFVLEPGTDFLLRLGGDAVSLASANGLSDARIGEALIRVG